MNIKINRNSETAIYLQIKGSIQNLIASSELAPGYKMPSERRLAQELSVHRNTVVKAYSELIAEGYLYASRQAPRGYFVKTPQAAQTFSGRFFPLEKKMLYDFNEREKFFLDIFYNSVHQESGCLGGIVMDRCAYPTEQMEEIASRMVYSSADETQRLKKNICKILSGENIYVNPRNIQIVSETNQALNYLMALFLHQGDCILVEEPITPDNVSLFRQKELQLVTVPMEADGMNLSVLEALIHKHHPKFIYTMPSYHNPTGITMSLEKRLRLLQIAQACNIPIIEDDCLREFRYTEHRLPSLYSLDSHKSVVYLHSFTLSFPYEIKTGYILGPYDLAERLGYCIMVNETSVGNLGLYLLNEYIERGLFSKHLSWLAQHYRAKRDLLLSELEGLRNLGLSWETPQGGLLVWCSLDESIKERQLCSIASRKGLLIMPGFLFYPYGYLGAGHIRLCFSKGSDEEIRRCVALLKESLLECKRAGSTGDPEA